MYEQDFLTDSGYASGVDILSTHESSRSVSGKIFSVDDSLDNLLLIEAILHGCGDYEVASFSDARSALEAIKDEPPALLLLDIMMPEMTGPELLRILREDNDLPKFPVIMVTAKQLSEISPENTSQASDIILKPFQIDNLLEKVDFQLTRCQSLVQQPVS